MKIFNLNKHDVQAVLELRGDVVGKSVPTSFLNFIANKIVIYIFILEWIYYNDSN